MTASKRKNDDASRVHSMTKMVIVDVNKDSVTDDENGQDNAAPSVVSKEAQTMDLMKHIMAQWRDEEAKDNKIGDDDPVAHAIRFMHEDDLDAEEKLLGESHQILSNLEMELQQAKDLCRQESSVLSELADQLTHFRAQRSVLLKEIDELDERQRISQGNIATYVEEASQELDLINEVEEEKKRQVPRLKTTISLYASTTGIKWDFAHTDILSGQVVSRTGRR